MVSNKFSFIWVVLFLCMLSFSNIVGASEMYANRKQLNPDQRCKRGRVTVEVNEVRVPREKAANAPRCHNYL
ncbi:hypothetical protein MtrunA17_Chr4g0019001 [Medicago truncatula]|uniref:Transmembrane protein, putative n=1 Tax=Medicago truncatula TaxID=3880 RepID=A0A072UUC3_MEDTR|nr:transmembrane protein, putative [Medicago truncatula]RHN59880.1 hypothetical protein MtrunA17_Chr4g0019001 [Medicago truncatula]